MADLTITTRAGEHIRISELRGKVVILAFISKAACHTTYALELLDLIVLEIGLTHVAGFACVVDLERNETLREYAPFTIPVAEARRREIAEYIGVSMAGFPLPQFLVIDRQGRHRLLLLPRGEDFWETVNNFRMPIEAILDEPIAEPAQQPEVQV